MEFRILGSVEFWRQQERVTFASRKLRTTLAALLLARENVLPDTSLSTALWGPEPPATSSSQIYTYVWKLRCQLQPHVRIERSQPGYVMRIGSARLDYAEFDRQAALGQRMLKSQRYEEASQLLTSALALWRGKAMADVSEFLAEAELPRLEETRMAALEGRFEADLHLGREQKLLPELAALVAEHPLRERPRAQLMTALYACGRQADALAVFREGRELLAAELGVDPSAMLSDVFHDILANKPTSVPRQTATITRGRPAARPQRYEVHPAMLPPQPLDFAGRREQFELLCRRLETKGLGGPDVITGIAGTGKSALALRVAHSCAGRFPDGQLWMDLGADEDGRAADPREVQACLLRAMGVPGDQLPTSAHELSQLYRGRLAGRRMLVLLDNVVDPRQVRPLLPGDTDSRVLLTSRSRLSSLEGARLVDLDVFDTAEGLEMLREIVGPERVLAEENEARQLLALCDGLPLAVRIAGARLADKPHWSIARLVRRMSDDSQLDELHLLDLDVRDSIARSYRQLGVAERRMMHQLSVAGVSAFTAQAAARCVGGPEEEVYDLLESLVDARIVTVSGTGPDGEVRYRLHRLMRLYGQERAEAEQPEFTLHPVAQPALLRVSAVRERDSGRHELRPQEDICRQS